MMENEQQQKPGMSSEQSADFAALQGMASATDLPAPGAQNSQVEQAPPKLTVAQELAGMISMIVKVIAPALPSVAELYTEEVTEGVGAAIGAVCDKRGWLQGGLMGEWGEEIACLMIVGPLAYSTYEAASADIGNLKAKARAKQGQEGRKSLAQADLSATAASDIQPGQKTVTFGVPEGAA